MPIEIGQRGSRSSEEERSSDGIACRLILAGVYLMVGGLMFYSGKDKVFDSVRNAPAGIEEQFEHSFLSTFPGTDTAWLVLGLFRVRRLRPARCEPGPARVPAPP